MGTALLSALVPLLVLSSCVFSSTVCFPAIAALHRKYTLPAKPVSDLPSVPHSIVTARTDDNSDKEFQGSNSNQLNKRLFTYHILSIAYVFSL